MKQQTSIFLDQDILTLTKKGERELHEPGTALTPMHLEALVLIDGYSTAAQVIKRGSNVAPDALRTKLNELIIKGYVTADKAPADGSFDPGNFFSIDTRRIAIPEADEHVNAEADADTEFLRRKGYCVNMARRPPTGAGQDEGRKPTVLIIDDDPDVCHVLELYLKLEGFAPRSAMNREEIVAALRHRPLPDMVLLDVVLGDGLNGFDLLAKMRQHPALKELPIIMLTAEATREAVLKGILGGADGYVTKPFEIHPLVKAVKTVLGLKFNGNTEDWDYSL